MPYGPNHGTAESLVQRDSSSARPGPCDVTGDYDCLLQVSQPVTSSGVTNVVTHDHDFWDGDHYITSLSGNIGYLDNDTKVLAAFILCIAHFIYKYPIGS